MYVLYIRSTNEADYSILRRLMGYIIHVKGEWKGGKEVILDGCLLDQVFDPQIIS
jgi:hypothetical protein